MREQPENSVTTLPAYGVMTSIALPHLQYPLLSHHASNIKTECSANGIQNAKSQIPNKQQLIKWSAHSLRSATARRLSASERTSPLVESVLCVNMCPIRQFK